MEEENPFEYLLPVTPDLFFGRWPLVEQVARDLKRTKGGSHAFIGGRRFGKSSLLIALHDYLRRSGDSRQVLPILMDFKEYVFAGEGQFFANLLREVWRRVDFNEQTAVDDPSPVRISIDQAPLAELSISTAQELSLDRFSTALRTILSQLEAAGGPGRLVLLLDEVDDALDYSWHKQLFNQLRSAIYGPKLSPYIKLVLAGSRRFLDEVTDRGSPLWNVLKIHYLESFNRATTLELCNLASELSEVAIEAVWQQSGGHPFLAQYLLYYLWEQGINTADETTVNRLARRFRMEEQAHLEGWCDAMELVGLRLYGHLALFPDWQEETDLVNAVIEPHLPNKRGLTALCYHGVVIHDEDWLRYKRTGELFRVWYLEEGPRLIAKATPPDRLEPVPEIKLIADLKQKSLESGNVAELELHLRHNDDDNYTVEVSFKLANSYAPSHPIVGELPHVRLDIEALRASSLNGRNYGQELTKMLFSDSRLRDAFIIARSHTPFRFRLRLDPRDLHLHSIRWETLLDVDKHRPLSISERIRISRYLESADTSNLQMRTLANFSALIVAANPTDLLDVYHLPPVPIGEEVTRVRTALSLPDAPVVAHAINEQRVTLNNITTALLNRPDVLYIVCHGGFYNGIPYLWLEKEDGTTAHITGMAFIERVLSLEYPPLLIVLASCQSAGQHDSTEALTALGPQLAAEGIPAVIAMQDNIEMKAVATFMPVFFRELRRDGQVDRALAVARGNLLDLNCWWQPVLWLRMPDGRLWHE